MTRRCPSKLYRPLQGWFSAREQVHLRRLVYQAFDLRETPYLVDACEHLVKWADDTYPDRMERLLAAVEIAGEKPSTTTETTAGPPRVLRLGEAGRT